MIIDCHGHYTTAPEPHKAYFSALVARLADPSLPELALAMISDEAIAASLEENQLRLLDERGTDLMVLSPQASAMRHDLDHPSTARLWARACNDLVARAVALFPDRFAGACQLPQTPSGGLDDSVAELRRCVEDLGFVGCNLNPDPSGGYWSAPPLTDEFWYPLYETLVELDVPAMIHVSDARNRVFHSLGAHYLNADTTVFMQLIEGDLFGRFPTLRLVIPHGGGAVPYHWGRFRGLADRLGRPALATHVMGNVFFDTCVYHQPGIDLLCQVVDVDNLLFASELLGAVRGMDPESGFNFDDTKRYLDAGPLSEDERRKVFELNARRVYPRLEARFPAGASGVAGRTGR